MRGKLDRTSTADPVGPEELGAVATLAAGMAASIDYLRPPADGFESRFPDTFFDALLVVSFGGPEGPGDPTQSQLPAICRLQEHVADLDIPQLPQDDLWRHWPWFG